MRIRSIITSLLAVVVTIGADAGTKVRNYSIKDGLNDSSPRCLIQDSKGLLWIGSWNGVNTFDGGSFSLINGYDGEPFGATRNIAETEEGLIWICNHDGISRINRNTGEIKVFKIGSGRAPQSVDAFTIRTSEKGHVFGVATNWGICYHRPEIDEMVPFNISGVNTTDINELLCAGENTIVLIKESGDVVFVYYSFDNEGIIEARSYGKPIEGLGVTGAFNVGDECVALVAADSLLVWDSRTGHVTKTLGIPKGIYSAGTHKKGSSKAFLAFRNSKTHEIDLTSGDIREVKELDGKNVSCLLYGTEGVLWAGSNGGGLISVIEENSGMDKYPNKDVFGDRVANVSSFMELPGGVILVGTEGNGIYSLFPDGSTKILNSSDGLTNDKVYTLVQGIGNDVLIGHEGEGVNVLTGGKIRNVLFPKPVSNVYTIRRDDSGDCWYLGVFGQGIAKFKAKRKPDGDYEVTEFKEWFFDDPNSFAGKHVTDIIVVKGNNKLIVSTLSEGCLVFDLEKERYMDQALCPDATLCLFLENDNSLWVGTGGFGLVHLTRENGGRPVSFRYDNTNGLHDLSVHGILMDSQGKIWASTNLGLSSIDPSDGTIVNYYGNDDLQSNEFSNSSCLAASDGTFLFGGVDGFNRFNPLTLRKRDFEPEVIFNRFSLIKEPSRIIPLHGPIELRHNENYFSINFSAIEFIENGNCGYAYMLEGFDSDWIEQEKRTPVTYSNIPPGKYKFLVKSTNGDQKWSSKISSLDIIVRRPWWSTIVAYIIYLAALMVAAYLIGLLINRRMRHKREMELKILQKQHENETYEAKLRFFTNIAHEFGTPLTLISGAGEQLNTYCALESRPTKYVNIIKDNADRMQRLIKELMDFRKVDTGNYQPVYSRFDIVEMTRHIAEGYSGASESGGISLTLDIPEGSRQFVSDYSAVEKILHNLISNAYKYTPDGGVISVSLLCDSDNSIKLSITNSGKGIKPEDITKVFDRFTVLENLESEAKGGRIVRNGIGLALVNSLVGALGGNVTVTSKRGESTAFTVILPSADDKLTEDETLLPTAEPFDVPDSLSYDSPSPTKPGITIIIVDDEKAIRDMVSDILGGSYTILQAGNGKEAIELISKGLPNMIITDIAMPEMDGIELCRYLKENEITRNIPIVFLSFLSDIQSEISSFETGGEAFIPKPFHPRYLQAVVNKILSGRDSLKSYYSSVISNSDMLNEKVVMKEDRDFIIKATALVEGCLADEGLSQAYLCEKLNISGSQLYRKLKELVGLSPVEFIRSIRLEHAAQQLKTTNLTVQEIMYASGFNNKSYFYREFGKKYGMSPREFRQSEKAK